MSDVIIHKRIQLEAMDISLTDLRITRRQEMEKMQQSLQRLGQLHPVAVRFSDNKYQLLDGFKRYHAARHLGWEFLEARVLEVTLIEGKAIMLSYNRGGRSLLNYDEALVVYSLKSEHLLDQVAISAMTGYSRSWVCRRLALIEKLDSALQDALRMGTITNSQAKSLVKLPRGNQQEVMQCIIAHRLTSRHSALLAEKYLQSGSCKEQQYVLSYPMEVIEGSMSKNEIYDVRLSRHGNRLLKSSELLFFQQNQFIGLCKQHLTEHLNDMETAVLEAKINRLKKGVGTIQAIINDKTWKNAG